MRHPPHLIISIRNRTHSNIVFASHINAADFESICHINIEIILLYYLSITIYLFNILTLFLSTDNKINLDYQSYLFSFNIYNLKIEIKNA